MEQWNSLESTEVWTAAKRCAFIVLCVSGALSATAAVLLIGAPGMVPTAGGMLLWGVIAVTLSAAVAGWERTPTGYLLLLIAATLEVFAPRIVPHLNPADMRETLSAFSQAAGMPMLVGALLAIKDLVQRVWFGLSLKRTEARIETAVDVMNLMSEDDGDAVRQNVKYRLLVVPTIVIAIGLYVSLVGTIRTGLNDALVQVNAVATGAVAPTSRPTPTTIQGGILRSVETSAVPNAVTEKRRADATTHVAPTVAPINPTFIHLLLGAIGIIFITPFMGLLEWAIYKKQW